MTSTETKSVQKLPLLTLTAIVSLEVGAGVFSLPRNSPRPPGCSAIIAGRSRASAAHARFRVSAPAGATDLDAGCTHAKAGSGVLRLLLASGTGPAPARQRQLWVRSSRRSAPWSPALVRHTIRAVPSQPAHLAFTS